MGACTGRGAAGAGAAGSEALAGAGAGAGAAALAWTAGAGATTAGRTGQSPVPSSGRTSFQPATMMSGLSTWSWLSSSSSVQRLASPSSHWAIRLRDSPGVTSWTGTWAGAGGGGETAMAVAISSAFMGNFLPFRLTVEGAVTSGRAARCHGQVVGGNQRRTVASVDRSRSAVRWRAQCVGSVTISQPRS